MLRKIMIVCSILMIGILTSCEYSLNDEKSAVNSMESNIAEESSVAQGSNETSDTAQEENEEMTIGSVTNVDLGKIDSIEICRRNIEEESTCVLTGVDASDFGEKLINIKLKEFNKKEYDAITGGDEVYTILLKDGKSIRIVYTGAFEIDGEKYLRKDKKIDLAITYDVTWNTVKVDQKWLMRKGCVAYELKLIMVRTTKENLFVKGGFG